MNVFGDYKSEWVKRFPESELHSAWADDVRTNLEKHRTRVVVLREELEKEEFYVKYLENLLLDAEKYRKSVNFPAHDSVDVLESNGVECDDNEHDQGLVEICSNPVEPDKPIFGLENDLVVVTDVDRTDRTRAAEPVTPPSEKGHFGSSRHAPDLTDHSSTAVHLEVDDLNGDPDQSQFVTVIEVNGTEAGKIAPKASDKNESAASTDRSKWCAVDVDGSSRDWDSRSKPGGGSGTTSAESSPAVRKKVPPKPPPKRLRRPNSEQPLSPMCGQMTNISNPSTFTPVRTEAAIRTSSPQSSDGSPGSQKSPEKPPAGPRATSMTAVPSSPVKAKQLIAAAEDVSTRPSLESCDSLDQIVCTAAVPVCSLAKVSTSNDEAEGGASESSAGGYSGDTLKSQASALSCTSDSHSGVSLDGDASGSSPTSGRATSASLNSVPSVDDEDVNDYVNIDYFLKKRDARKRRDHGESVSTDTEGDDGILEDDVDDVDVGVLLRTLASDNEDDMLADKEDAGTSSAASKTEFGVHSGLAKSSGFVERAVESKLTQKSPALAVADRSVNVTPPLPPKNIGRSKMALNQQEDFTTNNVSENPRLQPLEKVSDAGSVTMSECIISSILESEVTYLECLNLLIQYMKALRSTIGTSQPVISQEDLSVVFHKIPELHEMHRTFVEGIRTRVRQPRPPDGRLAVGDHFKQLASRLTTYESFLQNYPRAIETIRKCSAENAKFSEITKDIKLKALKGQAVTLEDLLHKPVARVQKNALVIHDLLKHTPDSHPDYKALQVALRMTQCFLNEFNMSATESMFPVHDHTQRHLVKNSFVVELSEGRRKLRHLFLFNDVIVCAKYKPSGREKFTYEVKWYLSLSDVVLPQDDVNSDAELKESSPVSVLSLKSQVATVRDQILVEENSSKEKSRSGSRNSDKHRKKLAELQAQLVLASPNLVFRVGQKSSSGKIYVFFLSSKFEKSQWAEAITVVQAHAPLPSSTLSLYELQTWITTCRKFLQTNMGSFLLKSGKDDSLVGDLHVILKSLNGLRKPADMFLCLEVDSYGHFFQKGKTKIFCGVDLAVPFERHEFVVELDGSHFLRLICYEQVPHAEPIIRGRATIELNKSWLTGRLQEKSVSLQDFTVEMAMKFAQCEISLRRVPSSKPCSLFGVKVSSVAKKEKRSIPFLITCCAQEVEKRGLHELGLYRVSGSSTDVQKLRRTFESNAYEAEQLVKEMDIHSVTGLFKLYLRELPEGLFTDDLYHKLLDTFGMADGEAKSRELLHVFESLPTVNKDIVLYLIEHMMKINKDEALNKMSLQNLATVFGPTLIRPSARLENSVQSDRLASGTIDVMAQAGILYFYLKKRSSGQTLGIPSDAGGLTPFR